MSSRIRELLAIPVVAGVTALAVKAPEGSEIVGLADGDKDLAIAAKRRIFVPGGQITVVLTSGAEIRDGTALHVHLKKNDQPSETPSTVRMMSWRDSETAKVARLVAANVLPKLKAADHGPILRFFSQSASWREICPVRRLPDASLVGLVPLSTFSLKEELSFFNFRQNRLSLIHAEVCELNKSTAIVKLPPDCGEVLFLDVDDKLVEFQLAPEQLNFSHIAEVAVSKKKAA